MSAPVEFSDASGDMNSDH